jgi:hypothetical protein
LKKSIKNIKKDHYKNYFIYAYNKNFYKGKKGSKKSSKHRKSKIYKSAFKIRILPISENLWTMNIINTFEILINNLQYKLFYTPNQK